MNQGLSSRGKPVEGPDGLHIDQDKKSKEERGLHVHAYYEPDAVLGALCMDSLTPTTNPQTRCLHHAGEEAGQRH